MEQKIIKRYSLSQQVSDKLERMIENGEYKVGDKIPTEVELMSQFDVSRNTIREAIQSLTSAGILVVKQGDGTYVKTTNRFSGCMNLTCEKFSIDDVKETRDALEVTIARLTAERRTSDDMKKIETAFLNRKSLNSTVKENTLADINFHMAIAESCHNKIIYDLYKSISSFIESHISKRHIETNMNEELIDSLHEKLFIAIRDQQADEASICAHDILKI